MSIRRIAPVALILVWATTAALFASGTKEATPAPSGGTTSDSLAAVDPSSQTVTYWYQHSGSREKALQAMISDFNATNQWHITVKGEYAGGYDQTYNKMITAIAGNSMPDLVVAYQNQAATYEESGVLVDLNPYVKSTKWGVEDQLSDFFPGFINQDINSQFGGKRLGFPPNRSMEVLYYNADWMRKLGLSTPPASWSDFLSMCKAATNKANGTVGYDISTDASNVFAQVISRGGNITGPGGKGYSLDTPEMKASMTFMQNLYKSGYAQKIAEKYGDQTDFGNSKSMFAMGSTSGLPFYEQAVSGSKQPFAWSVAAIPHTMAKPVLNIYGASISVTKSTPAKELASWLFIRWMSEPKQQAEWTRVSNYFPVRISTADSLGDYLKQNPRFADAFDLLKSSDTLAEPPFAGYDLVRDAISAAFNAILDGADVNTTLSDLNTKANKLYKESTAG